MFTLVPYLMTLTIHTPGRRRMGKDSACQRFRHRVRDKRLTRQWRLTGGLTYAHSPRKHEGDRFISPRLFEDAKRLNAAPSTWAADTSTIFHVRGFEYGALFYVTDCYVIASNNGSADLSLSVVKVHFQNHLETVSYSRAGDILYEVHLPNTVLWSPTPGLA